MHPRTQHSTSDRPFEQSACPRAHGVGLGPEQQNHEGEPFAAWGRQLGDGSSVGRSSCEHCSN
eukprot:1982843-Alexandrium_andersonii.AAC.1